MFVVEVVVKGKACTVLNSINNKKPSNYSKYQYILEEPNQVNMKWKQKRN